MPSIIELLERVRPRMGYKLTSDATTITGATWVFPSGVMDRTRSDTCRLGLGVKEYRSISVVIWNFFEILHRQRVPLVCYPGSICRTSIHQDDVTDVLAYLNCDLGFNLGAGEERVTNGFLQPTLGIICQVMDKLSRDGWYRAIVTYGMVWASGYLNGELFKAMHIRTEDLLNFRFNKWSNGRSYLLGDLQSVPSAEELIAAVRLTLDVKQLLDFTLIGNNDDIPLYKESCPTPLGCKLGLIYLDDALRMSTQTESHSSRRATIADHIVAQFFGDCEWIDYVNLISPDLTNILELSTNINEYIFKGVTIGRFDQPWYYYEGMYLRDTEGCAISLQLIAAGLPSTDFLDRTVFVGTTISPMYKLRKPHEFIEPSQTNLIVTLSDVINAPILGGQSFKEFARGVAGCEDVADFRDFAKEVDINGQPLMSFFPAKFHTPDDLRNIRLSVLKMFTPPKQRLPPDLDRVADMSYQELNKFMISILPITDEDLSKNAKYPDIHRIFNTFLRAEEICSGIELTPEVSYGFVPNWEQVNKFFKVCIMYSNEDTSYQLFVNTFQYGLMSRYHYEIALIMISLGWFTTVGAKLMDICQQADRCAHITGHDVFTGRDCRGIGHVYSLHSLGPWGPFTNDKKAAFLQYATTLAKFVGLCNDIRDYDPKTMYYEYPPRPLSECVDYLGNKITAGDELIKIFDQDPKDPDVLKALMVAPGGRNINGATQLRVDLLYAAMLKKMNLEGQHLFVRYMDKVGTLDKERVARMWQEAQSGSPGPWVPVPGFAKKLTVCVLASQPHD